MYLKSVAIQKYKNYFCKKSIIQSLTKSMKNIIAVFSCIWLVACSVDDKAASYSKEAEALLSANDISKAEEKLKEGLTKLEGHHRLKEDLIALYVKSNQIKKLEEYLSVVNLDAVNKLRLFVGQDALANYYTKEQNFEKSLKYSTAAGNTIMNSGMPGCLAAASHHFKNATIISAIVGEKENAFMFYRKVAAIANSEQCQNDQRYKNMILDNLKQAHEAIEIL